MNFILQVCILVASRKGVDESGLPLRLRARDESTQPVGSASHLNAVVLLEEKHTVQTVEGLKETVDVPAPRWRNPLLLLFSILSSSSLLIFLGMLLSVWLQKQALRTQTPCTESKAYLRTTIY